MNNPIYQCPNCGHTLEIEVKQSRQPRGGSGRAPRQVMAMGDVSPMPAFKSHVKPIFSFQWEYLGMAALVGAGATLLASVVISSACYFAGQCFETPFGGITVLVITFVVSFVSALQFFDGGRYERKDEPVTTAAYAPPLLAKQEPQVVRVELKERTSRTHVRWSWFDLPQGINPDTMRRIALASQANNWQFSRPLFCTTHRLMSEYKYHKLAAVLRERGLLVTDTNKSELTASGRGFLRRFLTI